MASPFPGMDPYLEDPAIWSGVHAAVLAAAFEQLGPIVRPRYAVRFEERVFVADEDDPAYRLVVPDVRVVERDPSAPWRASGSSAAAIAEPRPATLPTDAQEVRERSLHVIDVRDRSVVTVIEMLSPTNKTPRSAGRASFLRKRREVLAAGANWVELDLLRGGARTPVDPSPADYRVYLVRGGPPPAAFTWAIRLADRLPTVGVPLRAGDDDAPLDLQAAVDAAVRRGSYDLDADYAADPVPPLPAAAAEWARAVVAGHDRG